MTSAGNPDLQAEDANDWEFGYGHRLDSDSNVQFNAYVTAVGNQLFSASEPNLQYGLANVTFAPGALAAKIAYVDYGYFVESSTKSGIVSQILASNPNTINGAQIAGIPLHQATLSLDVALGPWEVRLNNYYVGPNNTYNRPAFWHSDAFQSRSFDNGNALITLGGTNIFNQAVQTYGYIGLGTLFAENGDAIAAGNTQGPQEEFGLAPAQLTLTLHLKI